MGNEINRHTDDCRVENISIKWGKDNRISATLRWEVQNRKETHLGMHTLTSKAIEEKAEYFKFIYGKLPQRGVGTVFEAHTPGLQKLAEHGTGVQHVFYWHWRGCDESKWSVGWRRSQFCHWCACTCSSYSETMRCGTAPCSQWGPMQESKWMVAVVTKTGE